MMVGGFIASSVFFGVVFSYAVGYRLPDRAALTQSKSFAASPTLIWSTLLDIENYPLWKPHVKRVEMLGTSDAGYTRWREDYGFGKTVTYEITTYDPETLLEIQITSAQKSAMGVWIYRLSHYQERGVLTIKRFALIENPFNRFINRWIDTKMNEVDYQLVHLNHYLNQLMNDQAEIDRLFDQSTLENNEAPINTDAPMDTLPLE